MEHVVLVDEADEVVGTMEKLEAHTKGMLHRAFSILLFNSKGEMLLQKRSWKKYHSGGLWTNTCCSHPLPGEEMHKAVRRKLSQEMGISTSMAFAYKFIYRAELGNNLTEHEFDHVFTGRFDGQPVINREEVEAWKYASIHTVRSGISENPTDYTPWFQLMINHPQLKLLTA